MVLAPLAAQAQVKLSLVSPDASIKPGQPFKVAARLDHDPHWHTYWVNAGIGYPTRLKWELPAGWTAGEIEWPTPILIKGPKGEVTGHGYENTVYLPVTITPPKDAKPGDITIKVAAEWLMCEEQCIPGEGAAELKMPVAKGAPKANDEVRAAIAKQSKPEPSNVWQFNANRNGATVTMELVGNGAMKKPHFFSDDGFIQYDKPQAVAMKDGKLQFTMAVAEDKQAEAPKKLTGILAFTDNDGNYRGVPVSATLRGK